MVFGSILYALCWFDTDSMLPLHHHDVSEIFFAISYWKCVHMFMKMITPKRQLKFDIGSVFRSTIIVHRFYELFRLARVKKSHHHFEYSMFGTLYAVPSRMGFYSVTISIYNLDPFFRLFRPFCLFLSLSQFSSFCPSIFWSICVLIRINVYIFQFLWLMWADVRACLCVRACTGVVHICRKEFTSFAVLK